MKHFLQTTCAASVILALSGCATFDRIAEYPVQGKAARVAVVPKPMSKMSELPVGAFYDQDRQIIVTGHQKGIFTGMMFGIVGVLVADQMNKSSASGKYGDDSAKSTVDLASLTRELVARAASQGAAGWSVTAAESANLRLSPYAIFTIESNGEARLYAMLRAEVPGKDNKPAWSVRYFVRAPGLHKLDGDDTWMTGGRFEPAMRAALEKAVAVCLSDTQGRLTGTTPVTAKGRFPYINTDFELPLIVVQEDGGTITGRLAVGDAMVLAGTHVIDRTDYVIKPGKFKDPRK